MRHSPFYRISVIVICYAIFGVFLFSSFATSTETNPIVFWVIVGIFAAALILTIVLEEVATAKRIKKLEEEEAKEAQDGTKGS